MPPTDEKIKLQVARNDLAGFNAEGCCYVIGIDLKKQRGFEDTKWWKGGVKGRAGEVSPEVFHRLCKLRLRRGQGAITIADLDNPLVLPGKEGMMG